MDHESSGLRQAHCLSHHAAPSGPSEGQADIREWPGDTNGVDRLTRQPCQGVGGRSGADHCGQGIMIETHATLTVYTGEEDPADLYVSIGVAEAEITRPDDARAGARPPKAAWRLQSETGVDGDTAMHIHWLLDDRQAAGLPSATETDCDAGSSESRSRALVAAGQVLGKEYGPWPAGPHADGEGGLVPSLFASLNHPLGLFELADQSDVASTAGCALTTLGGYDGLPFVRALRVLRTSMVAADESSATLRSRTCC
jgi:hypothetical protein